MIAKSYIESTLRMLNRLYSASKTTKEATLYSKLAVLELCGWIEESMDDIILRCSVRDVRDSINRKYIEENVVKKNYGFDYDRHFRKMLIHLLGVITVERLERRIDARVQATFRATLRSLKPVRDSAAHTHIRGALGNINAPSVTMRHYKDLYAGLIAYDAQIRAKRY